MKKIENLLIGFRELKSNKLRTLLTMLGIIFGVGAVISMMSIGEGARQETLEQIELMGTNNIIIREKPFVRTDNKTKGSFSPGLNLKDAFSIQELNPMVEAVAPHRETIIKILYKTNLIETRLIGIYPNYFDIYNSQLSFGEYFKERNINNYSNVCVIGSRIKSKLFKFEEPIGKQIKIENLWFTIIGVVAPKKINPMDNDLPGIRDFNDDIYIPLTTMIYKITKQSSGPLSTLRMSANNISLLNNNIVQNYDKISINQITVKIKKDASISNAENLISRILERKHYGIVDYDILVPEKLLEQKQKTQRVFNIVMGAIAGISLLVGGIGIMNIMLANIMERTKEVGLRRAVGATKRDILFQFIYEALMISVSGGLIGILIGFFLTSLITGYAEWRTIITPFSIILAFFVSVGVGLIFGIFPAKKAAEKDPIESLRYE